MVEKIRQRMLTDQSRQKSYVDKRIKPLEFEVGNIVFLKISPMKGVMRFGIKGKLNPPFIWPFEILKPVGDLAYELALPLAISSEHNVFHVSMLRKYVSDDSHILSYESLKLRNDLSYEEVPVQILDREVKELRIKQIVLVKVLQMNHYIEEATREHEEETRAKYPHLFGMSNFEDEIIFKGPA